MDVSEAQITVLGAGAFGTALAAALAAAGRAVRLWGRDAQVLNEIARSGQNSRYLPGVALPRSLLIEADLARAVKDAALVLLAVPMQALRGLLCDPLLRQCATWAPAAAPWFVACCKGVERGTGLLPTELISSVLPSVPSAVLTGPSFAADLARLKPTALTLATTIPGAEAVQRALAGPALRPYLSDDPLGAQLGGALKNVIAIAAGIVTGLGLGESARAALLTRGFAEMVRLATVRGARMETLVGLSGLGDLVLTATSAQSRNFAYGLAIGRGEAPAQGVTVEGLTTALALAETGLAEALPITEAVAEVLAGRLRPADAVERLMARPLRWEAER